MKWIPCSERLPDCDYYALVSTKDDIYIAQLAITPIGDTMWFDVDDNIIGGVIAWMPLPEPYNE